LTALWREAGLAHPLVNAYQDCTMCRLVRDCRHQDLLARLFPQTISCARPVVARWRQDPAGACGYCYPCLMRRAALHAAGWDRGAHYRHDVLAQGDDTLAQRVRGRDLRALLLAVKTWEEAPADLEARLFLAAAPEALPATFLKTRGLLARGFAEIAAWLRAYNPPWLSSYWR
jgi:hypothetical protein